MFSAVLEELRHRLDAHVDHRARRDVVDDERDADRLGDGAEMRVEAALARLVVVGRDDEHRVRAGLLGMHGELDRLACVLFEPAPAMTGTRLVRGLDADLHDARCSSCESVGDSPVVPTGTRPCDPSRICQSTKARNASSSSEPLRMGVTSAGIEPLNMVASNKVCARTIVAPPGQGKRGVPCGEDERRPPW